MTREDDIYDLPICAICDNVIEYGGVIDDGRVVHGICLDSEEEEEHDDE